MVSLLSSAVFIGVVRAGWLIVVLRLFSSRICTTRSGLVVVIATSAVAMVCLARGGARVRVCIHDVVVTLFEKEAAHDRAMCVCARVHHV